VKRDAAQFREQNAREQGLTAQGCYSCGRTRRAFFSGLVKQIAAA
jgi:hypothetical protein